VADSTPHASACDINNGPPRLVRVLGADFRSLAVFRIALGAVCLYDLINRSFYLTAHYTDEGVLPRGALVDGAADWLWSLHFYSGTWQGQAILFGLTGVVAIGLIIGYRCGVMAALLFVLMTSMQQRNLMVTYGADVVIRVLLFWSMFLPLGARWSLDALLADPPVPRRRAVLCAGTVALLLQIMAIYIFTALLKNGEPWINGTAIYYVLHIDHWVRPAGQWLLAYPGVLTAMTHAVVWFELLGPLALLCPIKTSKVRMITIAAFGALQCGMAAFIDLGIFPIVSMIGMIALLPGSVWDGLEHRRLFGTVHRWATATGNVFLRVGRFNPRPMRAVARCNSWVTWILCGGLAIYMVAWNIDMLPAGRGTMPESLRFIGAYSRLDQRWNMFAPVPQRDDGWFAVDGRLADKSTIDPHTGEPYTQDKPPLSNHRRLNDRWQKFYHNLWIVDYHWAHSYYAEWLCREWRSNDPPLVGLRLYYMHEFTPPPGEAGTIEPIMLLEYNCY
jgi:hypothetical protein